MSPPAHASAARNGALLFAALAALAALLAFQPIRFALDRLAVDSTPTSVAPAAGLPWFAVFASTALAFVALGFALVAWLRWTRTEAALDGLAATAARLAIGERGLHAKPRTSALQPLAGALNRLGALNESAEEMLLDCDRRLAIVRKHARAGYWETDRDGRLQRLEYAPSWPSADHFGSVGCAHLEDARPLDRDAWQAALEALAAREAYADLVLERTTTSGRTIRVVESAEPRFAADGSFNGYCGTVRRLDSASTITDAAARAAVETATQPVFALAPSPWPLPIVWMNPAARALLGDRVHREPCPTLEALLDAMQGEATRDLQRAASTRTPLRRRIAVSDRYGARSEVLARLEPLEDGSGTLVLVLDSNEAEIARLRTAVDASDTLRAKVRELERQAHQLDSFAWSVSHDLRAPLRAVDGFARIVLEDHAAQLDEVAHEHLQRVLVASSRMERMIDALMALARSSTQPMHRVPVDLGRVARDVLATVVRSDPARAVQIHCEPSLVVAGDPDLLRMLLHNLLENAWKYTAKRACATIRFDATQDARGRTVYCVSDNGQGFDSAHADRLFSPFQRLHPDDDVPGTGIGLAIAQQIVHRHGGSIWAESTPGSGSRFHFTIGEAQTRADG